MKNGTSEKELMARRDALTLKYGKRRQRPKLDLSIRSIIRAHADALANVQEFLKPGDVVNISGRDHWWEPWYVVANAGIRGNQKRIFGLQSNWHDTHSMLYLDPEHTLSVQPPRAKWRTPVDYCRERLSIWRFTKHGSKFADSDIQVMRDHAEAHLIGITYDVGQLLDILVNRILGYPNVLKYRIFDWGKNLKVCSVGVRVLFEKLRQVLDDKGQPSFKKLFRKLNPLASWPGGVFPQSRIPDQYGVDVEATAPAHFANSRYFDNEFELIALFDDGWPVYPLA
jgi:hypothetical protein